MTKNIINYFPVSAGIVAAFLLIVAGAFSLFVIPQVQAASQESSGKRLITIHDRTQEKVILTHATSVKDALKDAGVALDQNDAVEPGLTQELVDNNYYINIYRARPVLVTDGIVRQKIMTPYQTADKIAKDAGIELNDADKTTLAPAENIVADGAGLELRIDRATPFTLVLYGKITTAYTQAQTVGAMLQEKNITLSANDEVSLPEDTPITPGMVVSLWRNGKQTVTEEKSVDFEVEKVHDTARPVGYREVQTPGVQGKRTVTYEVEIQGGREISRKEIQSVVLQAPKKQVEIIGAKPGNGLTKAKGVYMFTDSKGVTHRETYYDLPMNIVMQNCGGGGEYTIRADGAKIDKDGYVLVAAHLGRYVRCSIVETSLGLGKVYDTGSFTSKHPDGFDVATDWTNNNGR